MLRGVLVHCDSCGDEYRGVRAPAAGSPRDKIEAALRADGWDIAVPAGPYMSPDLGKHMCPVCVASRDFLPGAGEQQ